jgi:hypothetical protein
MGEARVCDLLWSKRLRSFERLLPRLQFDVEVASKRDALEPGVGRAEPDCRSDRPPSRQSS